MDITPPSTVEISDQKIIIAKSCSCRSWSYIYALRKVAFKNMEEQYSSFLPPEANCVQSSLSGSDGSVYIQWPPMPNDSASADFQVKGFPSWSVPFQEVAEEKSASASKSHSQAEKRRRDRINTQLGILRKLIPKSDKMEKAALLASVIDHVKDLKRKAMEVSKAFMIPTEVDEVTVDCDASQDSSPTNIKNKEKGSNTFVRASVCCDDRPELFLELVQALKGLRLAIVRADIASVGGRVKSILILRNKDGKDGASLSTIRQSLNVVLSRIASSSLPSPNCIRSKRQRFFLPSY